MSDVPKKKRPLRASRRRIKRVLPSSDTSFFETTYRTIWRQRWLMVSSAWVLCLAGWGAVALWPSHYVSSAVVYADTNRLINLQTPPDAELASAPEPNIPPVEQLTDMLFTGEHLRKIENSVGLDGQQLAALPQNITIRPTAPAVFVASYYHKDADTAHDVLNVLFSSFDTHARELSSAVEQDLQQEMSDLQTRISAAEANLAEFEQTNAAIVDNTTDIGMLEQEAAALEQQIRGGVEERDALAERLAELSLEQPSENEAVAEPLNEAQLVLKTAELAELETSLIELRRRYADTHPYVAEILQTIDSIQEEIDDNRNAEANVAEAEAAANDLNERLAALKLQHEAKITDVAKLNNDLANKKQEIEHLSDLTARASSVESEQVRLEDAVGDLKATLVSLTEYSDRIEQQANGLDSQQDGQAEQAPFKLINTPNFPDKPVGPSRLLCLALVFVGGVSIGGTAAALRNRSMGVFESAWELRQRFDVGVLGTISEILSPKERQRLGYAQLTFGLCCLALIGVFGGLAVAESMNVLTPWGERIRVQLLG